MKKLITIITCIFCINSFAQVIDVKDNVFQKLNKNTGKYEMVHEYDTVLMEPQWYQFKADISKSTVFLQLLPAANPNGYSTFIDYLNSGISGNNDISMFLTYWGLMNLNPTAAQKQIINAILTKNYFAIQIQ